MKSLFEKLRRRKPEANFWKSLWVLLTPVHKSLISLGVVLLVIESISLFEPWIIKEIIDYVYNHFGALSGNWRDQKHLIILIVAFFLMFIARDVVSQLKDVQVWRKIIVETIYNQYVAAHQKMLSLSLGYHEKEHSGRKMKKIHRGVDYTVNFIDNASYEFFPTIFQLVVSVIMLVWYDWWLVIIVIFTLIPFLLLSERLEKITRPMHKQWQNEEDRIAGKMVEVMGSINSIQAHGMEHVVQNIHEKNTRKLRDIHTVINKIYIRYNMIRDVLIAISMVIVLAIISYHTMIGVLTIGEFSLCFTLNIKNFVSLYRLARIKRVMSECEEAVRMLVKLMNEKPMIEDKSQPALFPEGNHKEFIRFDNVTFHYVQDSGDMQETKQHSGLNDVSFVIRSGEFVGIAGMTGSGKSTTIKLLLRHYDPDPDSGNIFIKGISLQKILRSDWRSRIGYVPQEVEIMSGTIADNIKLFCPGATLENVYNAAKLAEAHDFIMELPLGYDTPVGERGFKLSGGQRQLVGIARALIRETELLIFDEATSNVDSEHEAKIQHAIEKIRKRRQCTVIAVAHRLSTIENADTILVFGKGKLLEQGSHAQLLQLSHGGYAHLWNMQHKK